MTSIYQKESGQTLVEALLAVAFAVVVVVALVGVGITAMRTADYGKNQAEATRLSTEALELLRSQRDNSVWTSFSDTAKTCGYSSNAGCCIDVNAGLTPVSDITTCTIPSIYYRYVKATTVDTVNNKVIFDAHTVYYEGSLKRDVILTQTFTNWH